MADTIDDRRATFEVETPGTKENLLGGGLISPSMSSSSSSSSSSTSSSWSNKRRLLEKGCFKG